MAALHRPRAARASRRSAQRSSWLLCSRSSRRCIVGIAAFQVNQFSRLTSTGYEINELNRERAAKQAANHELEAEVARLSSLARVDMEARVRAAAWQPPTQKLYIDVNHAGADAADAADAVPAGGADGDEPAERRRTRSGSDCMRAAAVLLAAARPCCASAGARAETRAMFGQRGRMNMRLAAPRGVVRRRRRAC